MSLYDVRYMFLSIGDENFNFFILIQRGANNAIGPYSAELGTTSELKQNCCNMRFVPNFLKTD